MKSLVKHNGEEIFSFKKLSFICTVRLCENKICKSASSGAKCFYCTRTFNANSDYLSLVRIDNTTKYILVTNKTAKNVNMEMEIVLNLQKNKDILPATKVHDRNISYQGTSNFNYYQFYGIEKSLTTASTSIPTKAPFDDLIDKIVKELDTSESKDRVEAAKELITGITSLLDDLLNDITIREQKAKNVIDIMKTSPFVMDANNLVTKNTKQEEDIKLKSKEINELKGYFKQIEAAVKNTLGMSIKELLRNKEIKNNNGALSQIDI